jgi:hypothetical protein
VFIAFKASMIFSKSSEDGSEGNGVDNGTTVLDVDVAGEGGRNVSSSARRSYSLKVILDVEIGEEMVPSSCSSPNTSRDSVATVVMVTSASGSFSFPEKDSLYRLY